MAGLRKSSVLWEVKGVKFLVAEPLNFSRAQMLPNFKHLVERYLTMSREKESNFKLICQTLACEFEYEWIYMNIYPISVKAIKVKMMRFLGDVDKLRWTAVSKRGITWNEKMDDLISILDNGVDIKCLDTETIEYMEEIFGVAEGEEELLLYRDNCKPDGKDEPVRHSHKYKDWLLGDWGKCPRLRSCSGVDKGWLHELITARNEEEKKEGNRLKKQKKILEDRLKLQKLYSTKQVVAGPELDEHLGDAVELPGDVDSEDDKEYCPGSTSATKGPANVKVTRSGGNNADTESTEERFFPEVSVRTGPRTLNVDLMSVLVQAIAKYSLSPRVAIEFAGMLANEVFGQSWVIATAEQEIEIDRNVDVEQTEPPCKKSKQAQDLSNVLPTRQTVTSWSRDGYMLNFKLVAEKVTAARDRGDVVVLGVDDSVKADGNKKYDVKTGHITIVDKERKRTTFSTGFSHNISHSGSDQAENLEHTFAMMAVLAATTKEEVKSAIDFFMMDRAGDGKVMLDELEVTDEKRLNCNGHMILCEAACLDSLFVQLEAKIGAEKLISTKASFVFSGRGSKKQSIWTLGVIALSKLLGPRHCKESVSLSTDYKAFLRADSENNQSDTQLLSQTLLKQGFESFSSNRFGRTGSISSSIVNHKPVLLKFFEEAVDESANKLNLACSAYLESDFFLECCKVAKHSYDNLILPLQEALGIDKFKNQTSVYRSWDGLQQFFKEKIAWMEIQMRKTADMKGQERLQAESYGKIKEGWERQLSTMLFYREQDSGQVPDQTLDKMRQANVLTNSGCESHFADLDNMIKSSAGGNSNLETFSQRHVIAKNKYLVSENWMKMSEKEKRSKFRWARSSPQAKLVNEMAKDWLKKVEDSGKDAIQKKSLKKKKKNERSLKLLDQCKVHGGPLSSNEEDMKLLDTLMEKQLLLEVSYIRCTLDPTIKQRRKVEGKFQKFSIEELKLQIKNCLLPSDTLGSDLGSLLLDVLGFVDSENEDETGQLEDSPSLQPSLSPGVTGWWTGPLGEEQLGVLLTIDSLQLYKKTRYGFVPDDLPVVPGEWVCQAEINPECVAYYLRRGDWFLRF